MTSYCPLTGRYFEPCMKQGRPQDIFVSLHYVTPKFYTICFHQFFISLATRIIQLNNFAWPVTEMSKYCNKMFLIHSVLSKFFKTYYQGLKRSRHCPQCFSTVSRLCLNISVMSIISPCNLCCNEELNLAAATAMYKNNKNSNN